MLKKTSTLIIATIVSFLITACAQEPPKCSDDKTLSLVKKILLDKAGGSGGLSAEKSLENMIIELPRANAFDKNIKKYSCIAKLNVGGMTELPITYESQLDDKGQHIVSVFGTSSNDLAVVRAGLMAAIKKKGDDNRSVTKPAEAPTTSTPSDKAIVATSPTASKEYNVTGEQHIDSSVPIFCKDSKQVYQPIQRTSYKRLQQAFVKQFGYRHSLKSTSASAGVLVFSAHPKTNAGEKIYYDVEPHNGGIALLHLHVRLNSISEDLSGNDMCWKTFSIVNIKH